MIKLKKANNLEELYQAFNHQIPAIDENNDFYVEAYGDEIKKLRKKILLNQNMAATFFIFGQSGSGKTSALHHLRSDKLDSRYMTRFVTAGDYLEDLMDVDIIDILLLVGYAFVQDNEMLQSKYFSELEELKESNLGILQTTIQKDKLDKESEKLYMDISAKVGFLNFFKFNGGFFKDGIKDSSTRESIRRVMKIDRQKLIEKVNNIILEYKEKNLAEGCRPLLIIDDLEKAKNPKNIENIFIDNHAVFQQINCVKVVTTPVYVATRAPFNLSEMTHFGLRINPNPLDGEKKSDAKSKSNRKLLEDIIDIRLENRSLLSEKAVKELIVLSGGNIRQLFILIQKAAEETMDLEDEISTDPIKPNDVKKAKDKFASIFSMSLMQRTEILHKVGESHKIGSEISQDDQVVKSLLDNMLFAYFNGSVWYEVNPALRETVATYAKTKS